MPRTEKNGSEVAAVHRVGTGMIRADAVIYKMLRYWAPEDLTLYELRVKLPEDYEGEYMVVIKGVSDGKKLVSFHRSPDLSTAVIGAIDRYADDQLRWREDKYAGGANLEG